MKTVETYSKPSLLGGVLPWAARRVTFKNFAEEGAHLRSMVDEGTRDLSLRELALSIIMPHVRAKAEVDQALELAAWVQDHIYYVHEGMETFQSPATTLRMKAGDCDDFATLISSLCGTIGIRTRLCILKQKPGGTPFHIFPVALVKQDGVAHRITLDATLDQPIADMINPIALVKAAGRDCDAVFF